MTYAYYVLVPFQICALYRLSSEIYSLVEPEPDEPAFDLFSYFMTDAVLGGATIDRFNFVFNGFMSCNFINIFNL